MKATFKILKHNILYTKWQKGIITLEELKVIMEHMLILINEKKIKNYIDDISECIVNWEEADNWIINDWYIRALKLGIKKNALIVKQGVVTYHKDKQCEIKSFYSLRDALFWINHNNLFRIIKLFQI